MSKLALIEEVAKSAAAEGLSKRAIGELVDATMAGLTKLLKSEDRFAFPEFGTFSVVSRKARMGRNPATGESIKIKASRSVKFKPAAALKNAI